MATATIPNTEQLRAAELADRWTRTIAIAQGPLAGSHLEFDRHDQAYIRFTVHTDPGRTTLADLMAQRHRIATACEVNTAQIQLRAGVAGAPSRYRLTAVSTDPLDETVPVVDPRGEHGALRLGPYLDGDGEALWRLHTDGVTHSGVIVGGPGSGTTALTELIAVSSRHHADCTGPPRR